MIARVCVELRENVVLWEPPVRRGDHRGGCPPSLRRPFEEVCVHVRSIGSGPVLMWAI